MQRLALRKLKDNGCLTRSTLELIACKQSFDCRKVSCPVHYVFTYDLGHCTLLAGWLFIPLLEGGSIVNTT